MSTINLTGAATTVDPGRPWQVDKTFMLQTKLDFSKSASGQLFESAPSNADVLQVLRILAGWAVHWGSIYVETACAGADTITVTYGDEDDPNGWDNAVDLTSTGYNISAVGTDAYAIGSPKVYSSDDTLDLTVTANTNGTTITSGVIYVSALVTDLSDVSDVRMPAVV